MDYSRKNGVSAYLFVKVNALNKIDRLSFGLAVVDKKKYLARDVIIFPDGSVRHRGLGRWLGSHHKFRKSAITDLVQSGAKVVVIGTGIFSGVKLSTGIHDYAASCNVELVQLASNDAAKKFNDLNDEGKTVGALLHLPC